MTSLSSVPPPTKASQFRLAFSLLTSINQSPYMRTYILKHDASKMETFKTLIAQDKKDKVEGAEYLEAAAYLDVRAWFLTAFPEIKKTRDAHKEKVQAILTEVA